MATYAGLDGTATVEHDREGRVHKCIFQLGARNQDDVRKAFEHVTSQLEQDGWRVASTNTAADHAAGGTLTSFSKGSACRSVFWGCYLKLDDCTATIAETACSP